MQELPLDLALGSAIRRVRDAENRTQDDIARAARDMGLPWSRSVVAALERGGKALTAAELLLLPMVLRRAGLETIELENLMPQDQQVEVAASAVFRWGDLLKILGGRTRTISPHDFQAPMTVAMKQRAEALGEAEQKAARALNLDPFELVKRANRRWGRSLTDERDARVRERAKPNASPRTLQALRGHVTRELLAELRTKGRP